ncbi:MAG: 2-amino-4-hydroxy-6-hydroxymethyldihydropteridine diphosphokinase [Bacteroidetes bacterium]|nr:2-amino-4-hydroxy-6-hydroxymethyldihydropteridine diphosphokinase [Bacteroidota bacterium]
MNEAYLLIGGNEGERHGYLQQAREYVSRYWGDIVQASAIYETAAWGKTDQPNFLNQVLFIRTGLDAISLMKEILLAEEKMGRLRREKYSARFIDIDILFFNSSIINLPQLVIPHPEIANRRFVLSPMDEIAPKLLHPVLHKTIHTLLQECPDKLDVKKI